MSYENIITFIFFIPAFLCVLVGLFSMATCGCCCFCNNEQESPLPVRQRRRRARRRDHYICMSDCESTEVAPRGLASWRSRGNGHSEPANIYMHRDRRLCADFDTMVGPAPPSYAISMQHHYNYIWNQPTTAEVGRGASNVRMVESNHSHVHNVSLIRVLSGAEDSEETRLDELEEQEEEEEGEREGKEGEGRDGSSSPPPPYDKTETTSQADSH